MAVLVNVNGATALNVGNLWRRSLAAANQITPNTNVSVTPGSNTNGPSTFTSDGSTIYGVGIPVGVNNPGATGTFTVDLMEGATVRATVTVNAADLPMLSGSFSWTHFVFTTAYATTNGTTYNFRVTNNLTQTVTLGHNGSTMSRVITLATPLTSLAVDGTDRLILMKELKGPGQFGEFSNNIRIYLNNPSTDTYGQIDIGFGMTFWFDHAPSTNYKLTLLGDLNVWGGGTFQMGHHLTPMPANRVAEVHFNCSSAGQYGLNVHPGGTFNACGATKTRWTKLGATLSATGTSSTLASAPTGWNINDEVIFAATDHSGPSTNERRTLTSVSGATLGHAAITHTHTVSSTPPVDCEVGNFTSNVKIHGNQNNTSYVWLALNSTTDCRNAEIYYFGSNTSNKRGIEMIGIVNFDGCALHDFNANGTILVQSGGATSVNTINNCVIYSGTGNVFQTNASSANTSTFTNNLFIGSASASDCVLLNEITRVTFSGNTIIGGTSWGLRLSQSNRALGTYANNTIHSAGNQGLAFANTCLGGTMTGFKIYRCAVHGMSIGGDGGSFAFDNFTIFGCPSVMVQIAGFHAGIVFKSMVTYSDAQNPGSGVHIALNGGAVSNILFIDCGIRGSNGQVSLGGDHTFCHNVGFVNCTFSGSSLMVNGQTNIAEGGWIWFAKTGGTGEPETYMRYGTFRRDTGVFHGASGASIKGLPNVSAASGKKLELPLGVIPVTSGNTVSVSAFVRKSTLGDGAAYGGSQPRLIVKANPAVGLDTDVVLATASNAANGAWEQITGVAPAVTDDGAVEVVVDCDGTTSNAFINVDTVAAS